ncbi:hypothetical protein BHE97_04965 [Aeromicrobium sp. PE09-221]|nr:hypothetical protein BHE97_04965 [Aeromicrobium sp. PE09-221]
MLTLADIADDLQSEVHELAARAAESIYAELPDYVSISRDELLGSIHTNVSRGVACLRARRAPLDDGEGEPQRTTRRRMEQGMPIDAIIRAYRLNLTAIHHRFIEVARQRSLDPEETLFGSSLLWEVGDWFMDLAVREYRAHAVTDEVRRNVEKADVLRAFGDREGDHEGTLRRAEALGLDRGQRYRIVMTVCESHDPWVRKVESHGATPESPALAASLGSFAVGIVARDPREALVSGSIAAGTLESLEHIGRSWRSARRVLAQTDAVPGSWLDATEITWRMAVPEERLVHELISDKYLPALAGEHRFGRVLLDSVWTYLESSQSIRQASQRLVVHENTLRHRLQRFQQLTGADLADLHTVVELAWLREAVRTRAMPLP